MTYGEAELDRAKGYNEDAEEDGNGLSHDLDRGAHDARLAGTHARHAVPASRMQ